MNIKAILAVAAVTAFSSPVLAGPYVGVDTKSKFTGNNYGSCLLYTSPSPRDATLSRMPSSA